MEKLSAYFFKSYNLPIQTAWFKRALYALLLLKGLAWLWYFDLYFGSDAIIYSREVFLRGMGAPAFYLYAQASPAASYVFIVGLLCLCLLQLVRPLYFIPDLLIWFLVLNLHNKVYSTLTGGDYLLNQFLLFNCFLSATHFVSLTGPHTAKVLLHNLAVIAVMAQVCLVYLLSALAKCADPAWLSGDAVYAVSQVRHYSVHGQLFNGPGVVPSFLNYSVLIYQLLFPLLIWFKKIKRPFILTGLLMHACIALVMGLPWFGATMMIAYIYFWPRKEPTT